METKVKLMFAVVYTDDRVGDEPVMEPYANKDAILKEIGCLHNGVRINRIYSLSTDGEVTEYEIKFDGRLRIEKK